MKIKQVQVNASPSQQSYPDINVATRSISLKSPLLKYFERCRNSIRTRWQVIKTNLCKQVVNCFNIIAPISLWPYSNEYVVSNSSLFLYYVVMSVLITIMCDSYYLLFPPTFSKT